MTKYEFINLTEINIFNTKTLYYDDFLISMQRTNKNKIGNGIKLQLAFNV